MCLTQQPRGSATGYAVTGLGAGDEHARASSPLNQLLAWPFISLRGQQPTGLATGVAGWALASEASSPLDQHSTLINSLGSF